MRMSVDKSRLMSCRLMKLMMMYIRIHPCIWITTSRIVMTRRRRRSCCRRTRGISWIILLMLLVWWLLMLTVCISRLDAVWIGWMWSETKGL